MLALLTIRARFFFWPLVLAYNVVGVADLFIDYYHGTVLDLATVSGQLGATYVIPIVYVPILMITHVAALYLLARPQSKDVPDIAGAARAVDGISRV
jgi:hypothetical protein